MRWEVVVVVVVAVVAAAAAAEVKVGPEMSPIVRAAGVSCCAGEASVAKSRRNWTGDRPSSRWPLNLLLLFNNSNESKRKK